MFLLSRVNYPLPLRYEEQPDPRVLRQTIRQLREEVAELRNALQRAQAVAHGIPPPAAPSPSAEENRRLREENQQLRRILESRPELTAAAAKGDAATLSNELRILRAGIVFCRGDVFSRACGCCILNCECIGLL